MSPLTEKEPMSSFPFQARQRGLKSPMAASGEEMLVGQLGQEATCPLCLDFLEQPMILSCGHNFCHRCLAQLGAEASCPQCRVRVEPVSAYPNQPLANIVCHLKRRWLSEGAQEESNPSPPLSLCRSYVVGCVESASPRLQGRLRTLMEKNASVRRIVDSSKASLQTTLTRKNLERLLTTECPDVPERFDREFCVLGSEGFTTGWHWWEVSVQGDYNSLVRGTAWWAIGVAKESVPRKGTFQLSPQEGIWAVGKSV
ncbi:E3 ubiquitin-protein ligase TRIM7-like [Notechis scutatus]|uniref:E3 ubiquitin-protein ligase TRIM7-like n=1 Tax=Notechis scutatus TaxID=8663 RepID=A0A6J1VTG0_9SAUR|nr:E3 ubiquitin-protein ligase TRIM7-like [Notechis scutatus]